MTIYIYICFFFWHVHPATHFTFGAAGVKQRVLQLLPQIYDGCVADMVGALVDRQTLVIIYKGCCWGCQRAPDFKVKASNAHDSVLVFISTDDAWGTTAPIKD